MATGCLFGGSSADTPDLATPPDMSGDPGDGAHEHDMQPVPTDAAFIDANAPDLNPPDAAQPTDMSQDLGPDLPRPGCPEPIGRWTMDAQNAGFAPSEVQNGSPPIDLDGAPLVEVGRFGSALSLEQNADTFPSMSHHPLLEIERGSLSFWFQASNASLIGGAQAGLISKDANGFEAEGHFDVRLSNGDVNFRQQGNDANDQPLQRVLTDGGGITRVDQWHHVVVTWRPGRIELFHDGIPVDDDEVGGWSTTTNLEPIAIGYSGARSDTGSTMPAEAVFVGLIDELTIYDRVLPPGAVTELHAGCHANAP